VGQTLFFDFCKGGFILTMISLSPAFNKRFSEAINSYVVINLYSFPVMWNRQAVSAENEACLIKLKFFVTKFTTYMGKANSTAQSRVNYMLQSRFTILYDRCLCYLPSDISLHLSARFTSELYPLPFLGCWAHDFPVD
jgi:hypothetical protein